MCALKLCRRINQYWIYLQYRSKSLEHLLIQGFFFIFTIFYNPIEMVCDESDRRVKEKQPTSAQYMWELQTHSRRSWLREYQVCAKMSSRQREATLKNLKYKIHFDLFNTYLVTTCFHMCYFIVSMSSVLFYNVENSKNKEKHWNE